MIISQALADVLRAGGLSALTRQLRASGHVTDPGGLALENLTLLRGDAQGALTDLPPAAQAVVNAYAPPTSIDYGSDLQTDDEMAASADTAIQNLRAYLALATPTAAQSGAALKVVIRAVLFLIRWRFPNL